MLSYVFLPWAHAEPPRQLVVPPGPELLHLLTPPTANSELVPGHTLLLTLPGDCDLKITALVVPSLSEEGLPQTAAQRIVTALPLSKLWGSVPGGEPARLLIQPMPTSEPPEVKSDSKAEVASSGSGPLGFAWNLEEKSILLLERDKAVLAYNFGTIIAEHVPEKDPRRTRSCYIHPLYGTHGELLTDDFPRDHYHHHGVFWTWPHVKIEDQEYDLWADRGIKQKFIRWLGQYCGPFAQLGLENGWFIGDRQVMTERVWVTVYPEFSGTRVIDFELFFVPSLEIILWGAPGKSYGGFTVRFRAQPGRPVTITVPGGPAAEDLLETRLPWADFTTQFLDDGPQTGASIFIAPEHPDFPPTWLTRHYGAMCVGWPGVEPRTLPAGQAVRLAYRLWIHGKPVDEKEICQAWEAFCHTRRVAWE